MGDSVKRKKRPRGVKITFKKKYTPKPIYPDTDPEKDEERLQMEQLIAWVYENNAPSL